MNSISIIRVSSRTRAAGLATAVVIAASLQSGCIVGEIRDSLHAANAKLDIANGQLVRVNDGLASVDGQLSRVNAGLGGVDHDLGATNARLETTNTALEPLNERLVVLASLDKSLRETDVHLASLRNSLGSIGGWLPFVDLGEDEVPVEPSGNVANPPANAGLTGDQAGAADAEARADAAPDADAAEVAAQNTSVSDAAAVGEARAEAVAAPNGGAGSQARPAGRDPISGPWISAFPERRWALVLLPNGRYMLEDAVVGTKAQGAWKRVGAQLVLTPDGDDGAATAKAPGKPATPAAAPVMGDVRIVHSTTRSLTLTIDGALHILARP